MSKLNVAQIREAAAKFLEGAPQGLRYMELIKAVHALAPETPINTVHGGVHSLISRSNEVIRPSKGLWVLKKYVDSGATEPSSAAEKGTSTTEVDAKGLTHKVGEEQFYQSFADWLRDDADEVVEVLALGGASFKTKWGTPDVIGVYKPRKSDFVQFPIEIVTAEIKIDPGQSVVAFGQACAYRLFSHKTYIVMPRTITPDDQNRLEALCSIYGVGLVLFDLNSAEPNFSIVVKAQRFQPDMFYANEFARRLHDISKADFDRLF